MSDHLLPAKNIADAEQLERHANPELLRGLVSYKDYRSGEYYIAAKETDNGHR